MKAYYDGTYVPWAIKDSRTITISQLYKNENDPDLELRFDTGETEEFVGTFTATEEFRGITVKPTQWEEGLLSQNLNLSGSDSFLN